MSSEPTQVVQTFYDAFARRDGASMARCYSPAARFSDPVFPALDGQQAGLMWRMLTERASDLVVTHGPITANEQQATVRWEARYRFQATGRQVHNIIAAQIVVRNGLIVEHEDRFDFWRWSRMALGLPGLLLGWSPIVRNKVRRQAMAQLQKYAQRPSSA